MATPPHQPPAEASLASADPADRRLKVLIVDNDPDTVWTSQLLLEWEGYATRTALDGPSALAIAPTFRPDVILLDLVLPGLDGFEVARRLLPLKRGTGCRILAVTGRHRQPTDPPLASVGLDGYLLKPAPLDSLLQSLVREILESGPRRGAR
jgi:CheY-like chemotaxis protein